MDTRGGTQRDSAAGAGEAASGRCEGDRSECRRGGERQEREGRGSMESAHDDGGGAARVCDGVSLRGLRWEQTGEDGDRALPSECDGLDLSV